MAVIEATGKNIDELLQADYTVVDFYGDHCGACVYLAPVYNEAANDLPLIRFARANVDADPDLGKRFDIHALPTLRFFRKGELIHTAKGAMDRPELDRHIAHMLYD